ncbi:hypothetical protein [Burkholderia gladioli]|uniref:hypothetical protein n=1 Tax=Burkholderia gladioli TaxID=28095 RepID=UPI00118771FF|nr:hypothetical protein [Burkholderia gladioli]
MRSEAPNGLAFLGCTGTKFHVSDKGHPVTLNRSADGIARCRFKRYHSESLKHKTKSYFADTLPALERPTAMTNEKRFTVGQVKAMLAEIDAEFPPLSCEQIEASKASEKRRAADRKKREGVAILRAEVETLKARGMSIQQIADVLRGERLDEATPTLRKHLLETRR